MNQMSQTSNKTSGFLHTADRLSPKLNKMRDNGFNKDKHINNNVQIPLKIHLNHQSPNQIKLVSSSLSPKPNTTQLPSNLYNASFKTTGIGKLASQDIPTSNILLKETPAPEPPGKSMSTTKTKTEHQVPSRLLLSTPTVMSVSPPYEDQPREQPRPMNFLYPSIFLLISRVHIHRLFRSLTSSSLSSSLHQFTLDSSPYVHLLPISSPMELTVEVSALDLLSRRWSRMKRKRKLATAQSQASVGMGLLAGLNLYGSHCYLGNLHNSGVSVDIWTSYAVRIMAISVFPFVIV
ncbi:unnamed protein product [Brassica oleracea]